jgi:transposase InsO family protein
MAQQGRNERCSCGSGRKVKRCCGVRRGPLEVELAKAWLYQQARVAALMLDAGSDAEVVALLDAATRLPKQDVSMQLPLPGLLSPALDHVTVYRWVLRFTPMLAEAARPCRHAVGDRWQVDETYVKVAGQWRYVYRAIDQFGQAIDVFVSPRRDAAAARRGPPVLPTRHRYDTGRASRGEHRPRAGVPGGA